MAILGIDKLVFGVEDMKADQKFCRDFGLTEATVKSGYGLYRTAKPAEIAPSRSKKDMGKSKGKNTA